MPDILLSSIGPMIYNYCWDRRSDPAEISLKKVGFRNRRNLKRSAQRRDNWRRNPNQCSYLRRSKSERGVPNMDTAELPTFGHHPLRLVEHDLPWTSASHFGVRPRNYTLIFQLENCMHATIRCCPKIEEGLTNIARPTSETAPWA